MEPRLWVTPLVIAVATGLALTTLLSMASVARSPATRMREASGVPTRPSVTPLLGGLAILAAAMAASWFEGIIAQSQLFLTALGMSFAAGLWIELAQRTRREVAAIELVVTVLAVYAAGSEIHTLGQGIQLPAVLAMPAAAMAALVVVRSLGRMDVRGFRAWFAFIAIAWFAMFARRAGLEAQFVAALLLDGAVAGYLIFNAVLVRRTGARVCLGHAGGLMLAVAVAIMGLDVSQHSNASVPVTAILWVVLLPILDSASVLLARALRHADIFEADHRHLHDLLAANDYGESDTLFILLWLSMLFGGAGYLMWKVGLSQPMMAIVAVAVFGVYHALMGRAWRKLAGYYVVF